VDVDKLNNYLKITGIVSNVFRTQKTWKETIINCTVHWPFRMCCTVVKIGPLEHLWEHSSELAAHSDYLSGNAYGIPDIHSSCLGTVTSCLGWNFVFIIPQEKRALGRTRCGCWDILQDRQYTCSVTLRRVRVTIVAVEKTINIGYSGCMSVALFTQHAKRMRRIILSSVAFLVLPFFSVYLLNGSIFFFGGAGVGRILNT